MSVDQESGRRGGRRRPPAEALQALAPGDRVWMRPAEAGELAERFRTYHVLHEDGQVTTVPTDRGGGQCFG
jgi:D-serine deaminase-like pyridoxal phosphate-dependent protein